MTAVTVVDVCCLVPEPSHVDMAIEDRKTDEYENLPRVEKHRADAADCSEHFHIQRLVLILWDEVFAAGAAVNC